jgi:hypothetical protein
MNRCLTALAASALFGAALMALDAPPRGPPQPHPPK